jgi:hypothetical protein
MPPLHTKALSMPYTTYCFYSGLYLYLLCVASAAAMLGYSAWVARGRS